jgi:hypothetical protein
MSVAESNGYAPDELEHDDLPAADAFLIPGPGTDYDGDWELDLTPKACPDQIPGNYELDARLWAGRFSPVRATGQQRLRESTRLIFHSRAEVQAYCETAAAVTTAERGARLREAWGGEASDSFAYGAESIPQLIGGSALTRQFLPLIPGPVTRQLYWQSYFEMSAKAFEAYNHDPLTWRGVQLIEQFALGAGLQAKVTKSSGTGKGQTHDAAQEAWDRFWLVNKMDDRLKKIARDIEIMGEQFIRYFPEPGNPKGLVIRSLDPATIYDIVTDPEDFETVFFYHQQFQTPYQLYAPEGRAPAGGAPAPTGATQPGATTRYIIRQIDWREIDHYRINVGASERRGRSSLYPILGWIKRLRDYMTSRVIQADMQSRYAYDLEVKGTPGDVAKIKGQMFPGNRPPAPGSVLGHSAAVNLEAINFLQGQGGLGSDQTFEALVNIIAVGLGIPKEYLGIQGKGSRAGSLVATEPGAKRFQGAQEQLRLILEGIAKRFFERAGFNDAEITFTFPSIVTEERTAKLEDLARAEAMGWVSKQTSAQIAAKELDIEDYDFEQEQTLIAGEFPATEMEDDPDGEPDPVTGKKPQRPKQGDGKVRRQVIMATFRQAAKLDVTKSPTMEDEPPGLLVPTDGSAPASNGNGGPPATRGGLPANQNPASAAGASAIKNDLKARESEVPDFTPEQVAFVLREARAPRRRPDDPEFQKAGAAFREQAAQHLGDLVRQAGR